MARTDRTHPIRTPGDWRRRKPFVPIRLAPETDAERSAGGGAFLIAVSALVGAAMWGLALHAIIPFRHLIGAIAVSFS